MRSPDPTDPAAGVVPAEAAERLLERASQLDAAREGEVPVAQLRAVAAEAGISGVAFDAALAELQSVGEQRAPEVRGQLRRRRMMWSLVAVAALIAGSTLVISQRAAPAATVPMADEAYMLRCLSAVDAMGLIRPHLTLEANTVRVQEGSRVLNIHATPAQLQQIKAVLDKYESAGSPACPSRPPSAAAP